MIATGGRPDTTGVPGSAGEFRHNHFIVGQESSEDVRQRIRRIIGDPGPIVIGAIQGASYVSAMYELALGVDGLLRREGVRDRCPILFVTNEPSLGDLGFGQSAAGGFLRRQFERRDIEYRLGVEVTRISATEIVLGNTETLPVRASFLMPPFTGDVDLWKSPGLTNEKGLIPIDDGYRHTTAEHVFAAGEVARFSHPVAPLQGLELPHTGYLSMQMGRRAAQNVATSLGRGGPASNTLPYLLDIRVLEGADQGALLMSYGRTFLRHRALPLSEALAHKLKSFSERYVTRNLHIGKVGYL